MLGAVMAYLCEESGRQEKKKQTNKPGKQVDYFSFPALLLLRACLVAFSALYLFIFFVVSSFPSCPCLISIRVKPFGVVWRAAMSTKPSVTSQPEAHQQGIKRNVIFVVFGLFFFPLLPSNFQESESAAAKLSQTRQLRLKLETGKVSRQTHTHTHTHNAHTRTQI